jgi:hypothetical protein
MTYAAIRTRVVAALEECGYEPHIPLSHSAVQSLMIALRLTAAEIEVYSREEHARRGTLRAPLARRKS